MNLQDFIDIAQREQAAKTERDRKIKEIEQAYSDVTFTLKAAVAHRIGVQIGDAVTIFIPNSLYFDPPQPGWLDQISIFMSQNGTAKINAVFTPTAQKNPAKRNNFGTVSIALLGGFEIVKRVI